MSDMVLVNGEVITEEMFNSFYKRVIYELQEDEDFEITNENRKYVKTEILNSLIERVIILQEAEKENIVVDNTFVLSKIDEIKSANTEEELKRELDLLGLDEASLFEELKKEETINLYFQAHGFEGISFSEEDLKYFYESNKESMKEPDRITFYEIYVENEDSANKVLEALKDLTSIQDIDKILKIDDIDHIFHTDVPDIDLPQELFEAITEDLITDNLFKLKFEEGYFIYKIVDRKIGRELPYEEIKKTIAEYLINKAKMEFKEKIVKELMEKANIKYLDLSPLME